ncbi:pyridoxal phosphate-dependent transferase [Mycena galopus ATCC 62051]|nr:pyridoxal phosphate-dependent transferase [Mycena galopus ATCC 62051]
MPPSATTPIAAIAATNGNGAVTKAKNGVAKNGTNGTNGHGIVKKKDVKLSSEELIRLEHEHGAHNYHPLPVVCDRPQGAKVWDPEGREYIDMLSAYSAVNQGHCHPRIVAALSAQAQKLALSSRTFHNVFGVFAEKVGGLFGYGMDVRRAAFLYGRFAALEGVLRLTVPVSGAPLLRAFSFPFTLPFRPCIHARLSFFAAYEDNMATYDAHPGPPDEHGRRGGRVGAGAGAEVDALA